MMRLFEWMEFFFYLLFFFLPIFDRDIVETWELRENDNAKLAKKKNFKISLLVTEKRHRTEKGLVDEDCVEFSMFSFFFFSLFLKDGCPAADAICRRLIGTNGGLHLKRLTVKSPINF